MDSIMVALPLILLGLTIFINPIMSSIVLMGLSMFYFQKHDWGEEFFDDRWGTLGAITFLLGVTIYFVVVYMPFRL
jgi:hypothetical protein